MLDLNLNYQRLPFIKTSHILPRYIINVLLNDHIAIKTAFDPISIGFYLLKCTNLLIVVNRFNFGLDRFNLLAKFVVNVVLVRREILKLIIGDFHDLFDIAEVVLNLLNVDAGIDDES